jgi:hypothetical protein
MFPGVLLTRKIVEVSNERGSKKAARREKKNTLHGAESSMRSRQLRS